MNFRNIKTRLLIWYTIITIVILSIFSYILLDLFYKQNIKTVDKQLITVVNEINFNKHFYTPFSRDEFMIHNLYITIYKYENNIFKKIITNKPDLEIQNLTTIAKKEFQLFTFNNLRVVRLHSDKERGDIYIEAATTIKDKVEPSLRHLKNILMFLIPILLIIAIVSIYFIVKKSLIPVVKAINEVKAIKADDLEKRLTLNNSNDEIDELIATFNFLLGKLENSFYKIKRFSNDVSHELKTPLTVIRGEIELGLRKERTVEEYKEILNITLNETRSLQSLVDNLLFLSHSDDKEIKSRLELVDLDEIVTDVISLNKLLIEEKNITFEFIHLDNVVCKGHPVLLKILIGNIIQNAIKYSYKNSKIDIYLDDNVLKIKDYGTGIKEDDLKNIFDRFYRVNMSRGRDGYGLGLSIAKNIAQVHEFDISVDSRYGQYTQFIIKLK